MKNILRLRDRSETYRRMNSLTERSDPHWGRMSVHQRVCHLSDNCRVSLGERTVTPVGNLLSHTLIKYLMLYSFVRMPKGTSSTQELDQERGGTLPQDFGEDVRTLETLLERLASEGETNEVEHPFFGRLSRRQWGRFHYKHMDHHLRQFGA